MPVPPCLSPFSLSVVDYYADENENDKSCRVSLGLTQIADSCLQSEPSREAAGRLTFLLFRDIMGAS